jgi:hypothetical protein
MLRPLLAALCCLLLAPAAARADFSVVGFDVTPSGLQAGSHPNVTIAAEFTNHRLINPPEHVRDVTISLPPGLVGNPSATARCTQADFRADDCAASTRVGTTSVVTAIPLLLGLPITATGDVYNVQPSTGEPARLGVVVRPPLGADKVFIPVPIRLRPADGGLDSIITGLPTKIGIPLLGDVDMWVNSMSLTLFGTPGTTPFVTLPTSCAAATAHISARSGAGTSSSRSDSFTPTGCANVPFDPSAGIALENTRRGAPSGYTISLNVPADETPIRQAHVRRAEVVLPEGTTLSPPVATGLVACTNAQFTGGHCPAASQIGTVSFATPLIGTLGGTVSFGEPRGGAYRLLVEVAEQGVQLDLLGTVRLDPSTGRITTVFDDLPQVPFTAFALSFRGGDHAVLANPEGCGTYQLTSTLTPWSGGPVATPSASFTIGGGGQCSAPPFRPSLRVTAASTAAGRPAGALTMTIARPDGDQGLRRVTALLPPGLAGGINGIAICPEAAANAGTCAEASRLGSVSALVGTGGAPVPLTGRVYLTGPVDGSLIGMAIVIPGTVGPVDLGTVVTRAGIALRPADGGLTVRTRPLPRIVGGVPITIRELSLRLDRPGFITNASSCAAQTVRTVLEGTGGATATPSAPYRATDCAGLPFRPRVEASVSAGARPGLHTVITVPRGNAATASARVSLPRGFTIDTDALQRTCTLPQQPACPASSQVGRALARSPLLPVPLSGPVFLAQLPGQVLPGLRMALSGPVSLTLAGTVSGPGIKTEFAGIPDVPLERFELWFDADDSLRSQTDLCRGRLPRLTAELTGHNGATAKLATPMTVTGCTKPAATLTLHGRRLKLRVDAVRGGPALERVRLTLPRGLKAHPRRGEISPGARLSRRGVLSVAKPDARRITATLSGGAFTGRPRRAFVLETLDASGRVVTQRLRTRR